MAEPSSGAPFGRSPMNQGDTLGKDGQVATARGVGIGRASFDAISLRQNESHLTFPPLTYGQSTIADPTLRLPRLLIRAAERRRNN